MTAGLSKRFQRIINIKLHERPCIQSQAVAEVVTMDTDMNTSLRDRLVRTRIPNDVEREGQTSSTSFNIRKNKRNVEWLLKQSLSAFKLIQLRFNFDSTSIQLRFNFDSTSIQLRFNFDSTSIQLRFNFDSTSFQLRFNFDSTSFQHG